MSFCQCCGSMTFWCGSRSGFGSCYFRNWPSRRQQKPIFWKFFCLLLFEGTFTSFFKKDKNLKRSHQTVGIKVFLLFCLIEGSESGSRGPKNIRIRRIRIRICNTGFCNLFVQAKAAAGDETCPPGHPGGRGGGGVGDLPLGQRVHPRLPPLPGGLQRGRRPRPLQDSLHDSAASARGVSRRGWLALRFWCALPGRAGRFWRVGGHRAGLPHHHRYGYKPDDGWMQLFLDLVFLILFTYTQGCGSAFIWSGSSILGWIPIRIQDLVDQKLKKLNFFGSITIIYLPMFLGLHKEFQVTEEALKREHPALQNMNFQKKNLLLWVIFALLDPDPIRIRIQLESGSATLFLD